MSQQLLRFLEELSENNQKEWMDSHRSEFLEIRERFLGNVSLLLKRLIELEPGLVTLNPKDCVFRQNRDVRFSTNKMPYKTNMAAYFSVGGKKSSGPGFYLHIEPGKSFSAGGVWMPEAGILKKIRQEIDYSGKDLVAILKNPEFEDYFGEMQGEKLKSSPRDYGKEHPYLEYLKYKSFIISRPISDAAVRSEEYMGQALEAFWRMKPFHDFLSRTLEEAEDGKGFL